MKNGKKTDFTSFLNNLSNKYLLPLTQQHVEFIRKVWEMLESEIDNLPLPIIADLYTEPGARFIWKTKKYYIEIEILPTGLIRYFIRENGKDTHFGSDWYLIFREDKQISDYFSKCLCEYLSKMVLDEE